MDSNELKTRLEQHKMWLMNKSTGERFVAKNGEDLSYANLSSANLSSANLSSANLSSADLSYANFSSANFSSANLSSADLRYADLRYANLRYANLSCANLRYADLSYADLRSADLSSADLRYADLRYAAGFTFLPLQIVNTKFFITILDEHVLWGCRKMTFDEVKAFKFTDCTSDWDENEFKLNKKIITEMIRYYRPKDSL
ncbi:pentapeptide repeat-containing protein [Candidatus Dependentiae bacterium]|nr:MAG: pentapeptide repeat-containing protein [Candidatus Dependentiae bacterium]